MAELLIVEDDVDAAEALSEVLQLDGHVVAMAFNGVEGLARLEEHVPDVALVDIEMPALDGPGMSKRMFLHNLGFEEVPIILLSGAPQLRRVAAELGTPYFLAKPYTYEALTAVLTRALNERTAPAYRLLTPPAP